MSDVPVVSSVSDSGQGSSIEPPEKQPRLIAGVGDRTKRPLSVSPSKCQKSLQNLPGGCCLRCSVVLGPESKAVQCDLCGAWLHSKCEGMSDEMYDKVNAVLESSANNFVYYCDANNCNSRIKQLLFSYFTGEKQLQVTSAQPQFAAQQETLSKQISDLSQKLTDLSIKQQTLQNSVQSISSQITDSATQMDTDTPQNTPLPTPAASNSAVDIVNELADRDRRKQNVVVYNLVECSDRKADLEAFKALCNTVFKLDVSICKATRLGAKDANKIRPLLLVLEDADDKQHILSHSHFLKRHEQYNKVYIVPDRTKLERAKHKRAVNELKERRSQGETDLIIRGGVVVAKQRYHGSKNAQAPKTQTSSSNNSQLPNVQTSSSKDPSDQTNQSS